MSKKKVWKTQVSIEDRTDHSILNLRVKINKVEQRQNINNLNVDIDHYVVFYQLLQQVLGYYNQTITIEPYGKEVTE